jgi:hypothetical protein
MGVFTVPPGCRPTASHPGWPMSLGLSAQHTTGFAGWVLPSLYPTAGVLEDGMQQAAGTSVQAARRVHDSLGDAGSHDAEDNQVSPTSLDWPDLFSE